MKRLYYYIICICLLSSCDGLEISRNGNLDGMWHLVEVDTMFYGTQPKSADYTYEGIYWSVQDKLLQLDDKKNRYLPCLLRFNKEKDLLTVEDPYIYHERTQADEKIEDVSYLQPFGINGLKETFAIERLDRDKMILSGSSLTLRFKKY